MARKNLDIRCPTVPNVRAGSTLLFCATTNLNDLQVCLGGCRPWKHQSPPSQKQPTAGQQWPSQILRLKPREDVLLFSSPRDPLLQAWTVFVALDERPNEFLTARHECDIYICT